MASLTKTKLTAPAMVRFCILLAYHRDVWRIVVDSLRRSSDGSGPRRGGAGERGAGGPSGPPTFFYNFSRDFVELPPGLRSIVHVSDTHPWLVSDAPLLA